MIENSTPSLRIDLNEFKLHLLLINSPALTLHFSTPSRKFYLSLIALILYEMKKAGKIKTISMKDRFDLLALLNETIGCGAGSSNPQSLLHRVYTKWKDVLPNLEEAPLFKVLGRKKEEGNGTVGKVYSLTEAEKDGWANLFEYAGSEENVRLKLSLDRLGIALDQAHIVFGENQDQKAWEHYVAELKMGRQGKSDAVAEKAEPLQAKTPVPEPPVSLVVFPPEKTATRFSGHRWIILILVIGAVVAGGVWKFYSRPGPVPVAAQDRMKYPLPDKPSIAVLPFANLGGIRRSSFFAMG
jgi:hypothetical protein